MNGSGGIRRLVTRNSRHCWVISHVLCFRRGISVNRVRNDIIERVQVFLRHSNVSLPRNENNHIMEQRMNIGQTEPKGYQAVLALEKYLAQSKLTPTHKELIKIRASQINRCAFCIDMHTRDALKNGESAQRIFLLNAWRETDLFTDEERILLQVTEEVTLISKQGLTTATYEAALKAFGENYLSQIIIAVATINVWNRIAISSLTPIPA